VRVPAPHLGIISAKLFAEAAGLALRIHPQFQVSAVEFAETNDLREIDRDGTEGGAVGTQGRGDAPGVTVVILGAAGGVAIAEAIELFGVEGEDSKAAFHQGFDHGAARCLDPHGGEGGYDAVSSEPIQ